MGHGKHIPGLDGIERRRWQHKALFSSIHEARVDEIHLDKGTISITLIHAHYVDEIEMPVIGLSTSLPVGNTETSVDAYGRASWGRYIPQVGDILRVGFSSNGKAFALGYGAPFYPLFDYADRARESRGGIGWGETSGRDIQPGDWDFKSSRGTSFYMGNKAKLACGALSYTLDKPANKIIQSSALNSVRAGHSYCNFGEVRRIVLPMAGEGETNIFSARPTVGIIPFDVGKEFNVSVRWKGTLPLPSGTEIAGFSVGDVIDDSIPAPILMKSTGGGDVKWYRNVQDKTGFLSAFSEKIDDLGNYEVLDLAGPMFTWTTTAASWTITNTNTTITSSGTMTFNATTSYSVTSATINMTGMVNLGAATATDFIIKGTTFKAALDAYLINLNSIYTEIGILSGAASGACTGALLPLAGFFTDFAKQMALFITETSTLSSALSGVLSSNVKTI
jgi:hypothetical protein